MDAQPAKLSESQTLAVADAMLAEPVTAQRHHRDRIEREKARASRGRALGWIGLMAAFFGAGSR